VVQWFFKPINHQTNKLTHTMGIFWDLMQESRMEDQQAKADSLEDRVEQLEQELANVKGLLRKTLVALEEHIDVDIDGDGKKGA